MKFDLSVPEAVYVGTESEAKYWIDRYLETHKANGGLGLDTETTGLDIIRDRVIIWSLSDGQSRLCLPVDMLPVFKEPILENPAISFDLTNAKFDAHMLANMGVDISKAASMRDTAVQSWLWNENNQGRHGLKECTLDYLGRKSPTFEETFGKVPPKKVDKKTGALLSKTTKDLIYEAISDPVKMQSAVDYASLDAYNSTVLRRHFDKLLYSVDCGNGWTLFDYFHNIEVPFTYVLYKMERRGMTVDAGYLSGLDGPMQEEMMRIRREFAKESGRLMNLESSAKDPHWFFFEHLGYQPTKMTKGGTSGIKRPSLDKEVLEKWAGEGCKWSQLIQEYRKLSKTNGTYVRGIQKHLDDDFRVHTTLKQTGAVTGRLSSKEPNLQNLPRASDDKFRIREAFVPGPYKRLIVVDYAQVEMRLMAHFSGDEKMIAAIDSGMDLHSFTASEMYGIPYDDFIRAKKKDYGESTEDEKHLVYLRQAAKAIGFGIIYGIGPQGLAAQLTKESGRVVTNEEGAAYIAKWFSVFPGVQSYIESQKNRMWEVGYLQTYLKRFRRFGELRTMSRKDASRAERQGVNSEIQGSAADVAKMAMIKCEFDPELNEMGVELLMQVHDELIFECPDNDEIADRAQARIEEIMAHPFSEDLRVPLPVDGGQAYTWADAK